MPGPDLPEGDIFLNADGTPALLNIVGPDRTVRIAIADGALPASLTTAEYKATLEYFGSLLGIPPGEVPNSVAASGLLPSWHYPLIEEAYRTFAGQLGLQIEMVPADSNPPPDVVIAPVFGSADAGTGQGLPPLEAGATEMGINMHHRPQIMMYNLNSSDLLTDPIAAEKVITHEAGHTLGFKHPFVGYVQNQPYYDSIMHQMLYTEDGSVRQYFEPYPGATGLGTRDVENAHLVREWVREAYPNPALDMQLAVNAARTVWNVDDVMAEAVNQGTSPLINIPIIADAPQGNTLVLGSGNNTLFENEIYPSDVAPDQRRRVAFFGELNAVYGGGGSDNINYNAPYVSADTTVINGQTITAEQPEGDFDIFTVDSDLIEHMEIANDFEEIQLLKVTLERIISVSVEGSDLVFVALNGERIVLADHFQDATPLAAITVVGISGGPQPVQLPRTTDALPALAASIEALTGQPVVPVTPDMSTQSASVTEGQALYTAATTAGISRG